MNVIERLNNFQSSFHQLRQLLILALLNLVTNWVFLNLTYYLLRQCNPQKQSLTCQYKLYNERQYLRKYPPIILGIGAFFWVFFLSFIGNHVSRKRMYLLGQIISIIGTILIVSIKNYYVLLVGLFLIAAITSASSTFTFMLINQTFSTSFRQRSSAVLFIFWSIGQILLVGLCYQLSWFLFYLFSILISQISLLILSIFFIKQSAIFFYSRGDFQSALISLKSYMTISEEQLQQFRNQTVNEQIQKQQKIHSINICKFKAIRNRVVGSCCMMFSLQIIYYGSSYSIQRISNYQVYTNGLILACFQLLGYIFTTIFIKKLPRKFTISLFLISSCLLCISFIFLKNNILQSVLAGLIRISNCICFGIKSIYLQELFPVSVRSACVGLVLAFGFFASICAPYVVSLCENNEWNPIFVIGLVCIPSIPFIPLLKQTKGRPANMSIQEIQQQQKK